MSTTQKTKILKLKHKIFFFYYNFYLLVKSVTKGLKMFKLNVV